MKKKLLLLFLIVFLFTGNLYAQCVANFNYTVVQPSSSVVAFANGSTGSGPMTYTWDFGDGDSSNLTNPTHTYSGVGIYNACLTIYDSLGCSDFICQNVPVNFTPFVSLQFFDDSLFYYCTVPAAEDFYYYGYTNGYLPTDSIKFEVLFGDGIDSVFYLSAANIQINGMFTHIYTNAGSYIPSLIMTGPNQQADTVVANQIVVASTCGNISGIVYQDINNNCIYDAGDILLPNISLTLLNGTTLGGWASTDSNGVYSFNVPVGSTYTVQVNAPNGYSVHFTPSCPLSGIQTVSTIPSTGNDFGLNCPPGFDLRSWASGWRFRPGFTGSLCVHAFNQFCNTPNGQIELVFDADLTPLPDTAGIGYTVNGQTVTFPISSPDLYWSFCLPVQVSPNANIGDSVCVTVNLTPVAGDSIPSNNSQTFCFPVVNSWDPNDKYVTPSGEGVQGSVRPNTDLTYTIRFQNTGNAEAYNTYILDTIDQNLDISSIEVIATSHTMHWSLLTGNIIRFNYDNIMLPDSNANEPASHGYVSYKIKQNNNVAHLTQIQNSASIYFDFNQPIYTNMTVNTVDQFLSISQPENSSSQINVFPNPSNEKCQLFFNNRQLRKIIVTDAMGKEVLKGSFSTESHIINTSRLPEGIYTIKVIGENKTEGISKIVVFH